MSLFIAIIMGLECYLMIIRKDLHL